MSSKNVVMKKRNKLKTNQVIFEKFVMAFGLEKAGKYCYTFAAWISKIKNTKIKMFKQNN